MGGRLALLMTHTVCAIAVKLVQAKQLLALESMSSDRKQKVCDKLANMQRQIGPAGVTQLLECGGDFTKAYELATVSCGSGTLQKPGSCDITSQPGQNVRRSLDESTNVTHASGSEVEHMCDALCSNVKAEVHLCAYLHGLLRSCEVYGCGWVGSSSFTD